ncbi:MAG: LytTR family DNA-binding domain-containing protein [Lachnospiraceae bacterium]|nr:LytTR family DNA-binding domain-containing protein [Lachnospiraceae bacterium]
MRLAICDDNKKVCESLQTMLEQYIEQHKLMIQYDCFYSGQDLLDGKLDYDVYFMDVEMPGMNGMETARKIRSKNRETVIVFISAYDQYVFEGYEVKAFRYLIKPVDEAAFFHLMDEVLLEIKFGDKKILEFQNKKETVYIRQDEIEYIEVYGRKSIIYYNNKKKLEIYSSLTELERILKDQSFFRIHNSYIANVEMMEKIDGKSITMKSGMVLPISKYKAKAFREFYVSYWGRRLYDR